MNFKQSENMYHCCVAASQAIEHLKDLLQKEDVNDNYSELMKEIVLVDGLLNATHAGLRIGGWDYEAVHNPSPKNIPMIDIRNSIAQCIFYCNELSKYYEDFPNDNQMAVRCIKGLNQFVDFLEIQLK